MPIAPQPLPAEQRPTSMLETPTAAPPSDPSTVKRYAPPNQRRSLNRRKSGERLDRTNNSDGEKTQPQPRQHAAASRSNNSIGGVANHIDWNENHRPGSARLIALEGCCRSEAAQLLNDRWAAVMHNYNDQLIDLSERPIMYSGSSAPASGRLPHQLISGANSIGPSGTQMDFLSELRHAIRNAPAGSND